MTYTPDPDAPRSTPLIVIAVVAAFIGICMTVAAGPLLVRTALALLT